MEYIMEIIGQIYQEMISTEFGVNQEEIFIHKFSMSKSIFIS